MPELEIVWTALPRSVTASHLELAVFVSPRLGINASAAAGQPPPTFTVDDFPLFGDWPSRIASDVTFTVELDDGTQSPAQRIETPADPLDSGLWTHLFPAGSKVEAWSYRDYGSRRIRSFPVRWVTAYIRDLHRTIGQAYPSEQPPPEALDPIVGDLGGLTDTRPDDERDTGQPHVKPGPGGEEPGESWFVKLLKRIWHWILKVLYAILHWLHVHIGTPEPPPLPPEDGVATGPITFWTAQSPGPRSPTPSEQKVDATLTANGVVQQAAGFATLPPASDVETALAGRDHAFDFTQVQAFYRRESLPDPPLPEPDINDVPPPPPTPDWDFHRKLGALGDYPRLLERLGLVVVLRIPRPAATPSWVRVHAAFAADAPTTQVSPRTHCVVDGNRFRAVTRPGSELYDGALDLRGIDDRLQSSTAHFDLVQVDSDGAALKAIIAAATADRRRKLEGLGLFALRRLVQLDGGLPSDPPPPPPPAPSTVAAHRTAGIAVVHADRAYELRQRLVRMGTLQLDQGTDPGDLYADDLLRGFHVNVQDAGTGKWHSLCKRRGRYRLVDDTGAVVQEIGLDDTGYVKRSAASSEDDTTSDLYIHEAIVRWTGWSLVAPLPGSTIVPVPGTRVVKGRTVPTQGEAVDPMVSKAPPGFRLETRFAPEPGSLPRLRFGGRYRFHMPWVDLSGREAAQPSPPPQSNEIVYRRFEPLSPPAVLPGSPYTPGGSLETLVIRSDPTRTVQEYFQQTLKPIVPDWMVEDERYLLAAKTSELMAEQHGKLDDAFGAGGNHAHGRQVAERESGTFDKPAVPFGTPKTIPGSTPDQGSYVINTADAVLVTPYLPDPLAAGVALRGVPGLAGPVGVLAIKQLPSGEKVLQVPFTGTWPDLKAFRIHVAERPGTVPPGQIKESFMHASDPPTWNAADRILTVYLGKGEQATITYSTYLERKDLDLLGAWDWIDPGATDPKQLRSQAEIGAHWMISPPRALQLVHAVQHPLGPATLNATVNLRGAGQTFADLTGQMTLSVPTTGSIELAAAWNESLDDPAQPEPTTPHHEVSVAHWPVEIGWNETTPLPPTGNPWNVVPPARHEFGDTRHRTVDYSLIGTTRFREFLPPPIHDTTAELTQPGPTLKRSISSTAPPDPPDVVYVLPTFQWHGPPETQPLGGTGTQLGRERKGGGLRLYLSRPWFSSGDDELVGVILDAGASLAPTLVSRIGVDPFRLEQTNPATVTLDTGHFANADPALTEANVPLLDDPTKSATVVGFRPEFDKNRKLWRCDIDFDMTNLALKTWPFVRLAVTRYQRESITGAKLSKVILCDFAQLAPDRALVAVHDDPKHVTITVTGHGQAASIHTRMAFRWETAGTNPPDDLDWQPVTGTSGLPRLADFEAAVEPTQLGTGEFVWTTKLTLPDPPPSLLRIAVDELEVFPADEPADRKLEVATRWAAHIVYADRVRVR